MLKIVITGSSGFIGSYLTNALSNLGYKIIELDIKNGVNLTDSKSFDKIGKVDVIVHLAARSFVPDSFISPQSFYLENYISTLNVLEYARKNNIKVLYFSSYLYGSPVYLPIDELHPLSPHNPYSQTKLICEKLCEGYNRDFGLDIVVFRPFNIYGKGQNPSFLIPSILKQTDRGIINLQDPRPRRDFIHVIDVVAAVEKVIKLQPTGYLVFNIGSGKSYSINELTEQISKAVSKDLIINFANIYRKGEVLETVANINKAKNILFWEPKIDLKVGLTQMIN